MTIKNRIEKLEKQAPPADPGIVVLWTDENGQALATVDGVTMPEAEYRRRWTDCDAYPCVRVGVDWGKL